MQGDLTVPKLFASTNVRLLTECLGNTYDTKISKRFRPNKFTNNTKIIAKYIFFKTPLPYTNGESEWVNTETN
uniref:Uncharacterized protein n=1 Tax=Solanum tuberosum TaxID=4113 RepID=M1A729_SOLTU